MTPPGTPKASVVVLDSAAGLAGFTRPAGLGHVPADPFQEGADQHLVVPGETPNGDLRACGSIWWRGAPAVRGRPGGAIGHFFCGDAAAAAALLEAACRRLRLEGVAVAFAPMDGNTWRRYRLVTGGAGPGAEPPFALEPSNPDDWPDHFVAAGFSTLARYRSTVLTDLGDDDPRTARAERRMAAAGVTVRDLDPARFEQELGAIYAVSAVSFQRNFLFTPLSRSEFLAQNIPLRPVVDPRLVAIAEAGGEPVGFAFLVPDTAAEARGGPPTAVFKTLATLPGRRFAGLGALLVARMHRRAGELGYARVIHALMHDSNVSRNIFHHRAKTLREYTLYARDLTAPPAAGAGHSGLV